MASVFVARVTVAFSWSLWLRGAMPNSKPQKRYFQVSMKPYTVEFPCLVPYKKGEKFGFCNTCMCDVSVSHGGKADIKLHIVSRKSPGGGGSFTNLKVHRLAGMLLLNAFTYSAARITAIRQILSLHFSENSVLLLLPDKAQTS